MLASDLCFHESYLVTELILKVESHPRIAFRSLDEAPHLQNSLPHLECELDLCDFLLEAVYVALKGMKRCGVLRSLYFEINRVIKRVCHLVSCEEDRFVLEQLHPKNVA